MVAFNTTLPQYWNFITKLLIQREMFIFQRTHCKYATMARLHNEHMSNFPAVKHQHGGYPNMVTSTLYDVICKPRIEKCVAPVFAL